MSAGDLDRDAIIRSLRAAGARFAFLHGSRVGGTAREDSDIDVAAHFGGRDPAPWEVDVPPRVDLVVLDRAPLELSGRVALHGELLFDDDRPARVTWQAHTRRVHLDEELLQRALDRAFFAGRGLARERIVGVLLPRVRTRLARLRGLSDVARSALLCDVDRLAALKYFLLTAIEGCLNVAQHLCASEGWGPPSDNAEAMTLLAAHGVLSDELGRDLAAAVRFRNLLVHEYARVDDQRVAGYLDHVGEPEEFMASVVAWVDRQA